ncbi:MAG: GNAT family N-acetyltransferase [Gammaproteobacteria bacterium]|nr:GNAT family N-acetyltransferase [Gammaproteobacteria bacterium]
MRILGVSAFNFNLNETMSRLSAVLDNEKYVVFVARDGERGKVLGFIALYESYALYAEGAFGTIPEFYVRPEYRCMGVGRMLINRAKVFGAEKKWKRLEVTTPPLPQFDNALRFYEREQFAITGGRKLKVIL